MPVPETRKHPSGQQRKKGHQIRGRLFIPSAPTATLAYYAAGKKNSIDEMGSSRRSGISSSAFCIRSALIDYVLAAEKRGGVNR